MIYRVIFLILFSLLISHTGFSQETKGYEIDFKSPESVVNAIFYAAKTSDFGILEFICDPSSRGDGDTEMICGLPEVAKRVGDINKDEAAEKSLAEFTHAFASGKITGEITYFTDRGGNELAKVPFWFNQGGGESRNNEVMTLIKHHGNWYLYSF